MLFRYSVLDWYSITSGSMTPTIMVGEYLLVDKLEYGLRIPFLKEIKTYRTPKRGDIIVFISPIDNKTEYLKRIIGLPGEKIRIDNEDKLYINDELIVKKLVEIKNEYNAESYDTFIEDLKGIKHSIIQANNRASVTHYPMEVVIPENSFFILGDNRDNSLDSRTLGFIKRESIIGKARSILFGRKI